jgi:hypothetical protein
MVSTSLAPGCIRSHNGTSCFHMDGRSILYTEEIFVTNTHFYDESGHYM